MPNASDKTYSLSPELLGALACPETKQSLCLVSDQQLQAINHKIQLAELKTRSGELLETALEAALVREDGLYAYPVYQRIPVMLVDQAFKLPNC